MAVSSATNKILYSGNSSATEFATPYFLTNSDLVVVLRDSDGDETTLTITTHYTLTGATSEAGGTCTMLTAPATGETLVIYRDPPRTQAVIYNDQDEFPATTTNRALDKGIMVDQRLYDLISRALRLKESDAIGFGTFQAGSQRIVNLADGENAADAATYGQVQAATSLLQTNVPIDVALFQSRSAVALATIDGSVTGLRVNGYSDSGDGGAANYKRVVSEPAHEGKVQSADGAWWELAEQQVCAEMLGAVGDGAANDTTPLNDLFDYVRLALTSSVTSEGLATMVYGRPGAIYKITDSIDATGIVALNWGFDARGSIIDAHCTGKPAIDLLGSRWYRFKDLTLVGDASNTPTFGVQAGRINSTDQAGESIWDGVTMIGSFSRACVYNFACETCDYRSLRLYNDYNDADSTCLIMDGANHEDIESEFITQTVSSGTAQSFNQNIFYTADFRKLTIGPAVIVMGDTNQFHFHGGYLVSFTEEAIRTYKTINSRDWWFDIHFETNLGATGITHAILFDTTDAPSNVFIHGLRIKDLGPQCEVALFETTGNTRTLIIEGLHLTIGENLPGTVPIFGGVGAGTILVHGTIDWWSPYPLDLSDMSFNGSIMTPYATVITHTLGNYEIIRTPADADSRARLHKGNLRIYGISGSASPANYLELTGNIASGPPIISAEGSDTNIDILFTPKGTGRMRFGTHTGSGDAAVNGYITILAADGATIKLATIA